MLPKESSAALADPLATTQFERLWTGCVNLVENAVELDWAEYMDA